MPRRPVDPEQEWASRRRVPDAQVLDAASQFEAARRMLQSAPPGSGVMLPTMHVAILAIELHIKSLCAEVIHIPELESGWARVTSRPPRGHVRGELLREVSPALIGALERAVQTIPEFSGRDLASSLDEIAKLLEDSRYPYEPNADVSAYHYGSVMRLAEVVASFVSGLEPTESMEWKRSAG